MTIKQILRQIVKAHSNKTGFHMIKLTSVSKAFSLACVVALGLLSSLCFAQGSIRGRLIDPNGANITGLTQAVSITNQATGQQFQGETTIEGDYVITDVPAGTYDISFEFRTAMYLPYNQQGLIVGNGQNLEHDLHIEWSINLGTIGDDPGMLANDILRNSENQSGPPPRLSNGQVDFSGMWVAAPGANTNRPSVPYQSWAAEMDAEYRALGFNNAGAYCLPQSAVLATMGFPWQIVQKEDIMIQIMEFVTPGWRQVFLDGRGMPELWNPSWQGHSRGSWEGDTLVVVTEGFNEYTPGFGIHSDQLVVTERYTRPQMNRLLVEITVEDPEALTDSYTYTREFGMVTGQEILEFVCAEGNTDPSHWDEPVWRGRP